MTSALTNNLQPVDYTGAKMSPSKDYNSDAGISMLYGAINNIKRNEDIKNNRLERAYILNTPEVQPLPTNVKVSTPITINPTPNKTALTYPELQPTGTLAEIFGKVESNNNYKAINKTSGAMGKYQFLASTLDGLKGKYNKKFTTEQFMNNPSLQDEMFNILSKENQKSAPNYGLDPTNVLHLYGMWNLGPKQAGVVFGNKPLDTRTTNYISYNLPRGTEATKQNYINYHSGRLQ